MAHQEPTPHQPGGGENPEPAANRPAPARPEGETEKVEHPADHLPWGKLPPYLGSIKQRGGMPRVAEKYRRLYEAYLKRAAKQKDPKGADNQDAKGADK